MNNKQYHLAIDLINIVMRFIVSFAIISIVIMFSNTDSSQILRALCLLPAPIISYIIGAHTKHIWSFLALHIILMVAYTLTTGNIFISILYGLFLLVVTATTFVKKIKIEKTENENTSLLAISIIFLMNLYCNYLGLTDLKQFTLVLVIVYVLLYLLNMYLLNFEGFFQNNANMSNVPIHQIKNTNNTLILFFGSFCFFVMIIFTTLPIGAFFSFIGNLLIRVIRAFFSLFGGKEQEQVPEVEDIVVSESEGFMPSLEQEEPSAVWELLQNIFMGLITLALIAAIIALLVYGLFKLYQFYYEKKATNFRDKTEFISPFEKRENIAKSILSTSVKSFRSLFGQSNNEKIRKYFHKAVIAHIDSSEQLSKSLTPSQLSKYALVEPTGLLSGTADTGKIEQLTAYYEKARYSNEECSKEDILTVKRILK